MANFDAIKREIDANINSNGNQGITGKILNGVMSDMIDSVETEMEKIEEQITGISIEESDPIFAQSPAAAITEEDIERWNNPQTSGGTITGIIMNGEDKGTSGVVDLGKVITEHQDISGLAGKQELADGLAGKQDVITDLATIREGSSLGATALQSVPAGYVTESELTKALVDKVDKVAGKQLTTEDFTTALKNKLEGLSNFDSAEIDAAIQGLQTQIDTLIKGDASAAIESFNEIIAFLEGVSDTQDLSGIIASIESQIAGVQSSIPTKTSQLANDSGFLTEHQDISGLATKQALSDGLAGKQDVITDLTTIRQGASLGATALQSVPAGYVTESELTGMNLVNQTTLNNGLAGKKNFAIVSQSSSVVASAATDTCYIITSSAAGDVRITAFVAPVAAMAEYMFMFKGASTLTLPDGVLWSGGEVPEIDSSLHYELSIVGVKMADGTFYKAVLTGFKAA